MRKDYIDRLATKCVAAYKKNPQSWIVNVNTHVFVVFDYPDYGGLDMRTVKWLTGDCVDAIQEFVYEVGSGNIKFNKTNLKKNLTMQASRGYNI